MGNDAGPWTRLIDEHHRNAVRLEAARPEPPAWWSVPLGFLLPWPPLLAYALFRDEALVFAVLPYYAGLFLAGLVFLFSERLRPVSLGLLLGVWGVGLATQLLIR
jgi:hypothetical protein